MNTPRAPLGRLLTAMVTPFADDGSVDLTAAQALARHLVETGSEGIVVSGTTGESPTLSDAEKLDLVEVVCGEVGDDAAVVAGTGTYDTVHSVHLTREARARGAAGFLVVTPYYNKPPPEGIVRHFAAIAEAAGGAPILVYNIPQRVVLNLEPGLLARLGREVPGVCGVKQATTDLDQARAIAASGLALYAGNDDLLLPFLELGGVGGVHVASHLVGRDMLRVIELMAAGQAEDARTLDGQLQEVYRALSVTTNPIPVKAALNLLGHHVGGLRLPLVDATPGEVEQVRAALEHRGLLVHA
jgi:4-hydroxy-tetrahydrodipicolinate synthase